jgi:hypothetical protein
MFVGLLAQDLSKVCYCVISNTNSTSLRNTMIYWENVLEPFYQKSIGLDFYK